MAIHGVGWRGWSEAGQFGYVELGQGLLIVDEIRSVFLFDPLTLILSRRERELKHANLMPWPGERGRQSGLRCC
jgi:hypothetical protein